MFSLKQKAVKAATEPEPAESKQPLPRWRYLSITVISIIFLLFELYIALIRPLPTLVSCPIHLSLALCLVFLYKPLSESTGKKYFWVLDFAMMIIALFIAFYFIKDQNRLAFRIMMVDPLLSIDLFCSFALLIILMESVRRTLGKALFLFILVFIAYAFLGQYISGPFKYSGMDWKQFAEMISLSSDAIFGSPLSTSVTTLFYFFVFGSFFSACGGGQVLIDLGMKLSTKTAGGPAKAAVVSSGLIGMVSGSAVANVTTTGVMTIPLMKRTGYKPEQAAAVEAMSSTGGQIMPPIMGVGAFIMADMIGISYTKIALAALIPALAYYGSELLLVHLIAKKNNLQSLAKEQESGQEQVRVLPKLYRLIPIIVVVIMIFMGSSMSRAALTGIVLSILFAMISKETRMSLKQLVDVTTNGIKQAANLAIPTAACGIMIGIVVRSGAANKLTTIIQSVGDSSLAVALIIAMLGCMLLGMALPTVAAYLIANILFCSSLTSLGIGTLAANMFIFYFGVIAQITPPVCLASFTAAAIAGAEYWKTGWTAFVYASVAFLTPFVFVFKPAILMQGSMTNVVLIILIMAIGILLLTSAISGYFTSSLNPSIRILLALCAILVILPETISSTVGLIGGLAILAFSVIQGKRERQSTAAA